MHWVIQANHLSFPFLFYFLGFISHRSHFLATINNKLAWNVICRPFDSRHLYYYTNRKIGSKWSRQHLTSSNSISKISTVPQNTMRLKMWDNETKERKKERNMNGLFNEHHIKVKTYRVDGRMKKSHSNHWKFSILHANWNYFILDDAK